MSPISLNVSFFLFIVLIPGLVSGPFIPDLSISIIGLIFFYHLFKKDILLTQNSFFIKFFAFFYIIIVISSLLSEDILHSFESSIFYFRFCFLSLALFYLIKKKPDIIFYFLVILSSTFFIVSIDGIYEVINGNNIFQNKAFPGRIAGLFGDEWVIGSFLSRLLPLLIFLIIFSLERLSRFQILFLTLTVCLSIITIVYSGERTAYIILIISSFIYLLFFFKYFISTKPFITIFLTFLLVTLLCLPLFNKTNTDRLFHNFSNYTSVSVADNVYFSYYSSAYLMFIDKPILGHGPKSFRLLCDDFKLHKNGCNIHPHSTYFQLLSETGLLGFSFILLFFLYITWNIFKLFIKNDLAKNDWAMLSLLLSFFITTFPFIPSGSFFNNWLSIIYFLPMGFYLYLLAYKKDMLKPK